MKCLPVAKDDDQNKLETEALLFTRNNKRSGAFCTAFIAEMGVFSLFYRKFSGHLGNGSRMIFITF